MSRKRRSQRFPFVPGVALLPEDFGQRLARLKEFLGLTWEGFASMIGVDYRQMLRWRNRCLAEWIFSWAVIWRSQPGGGSRAVGRQRWVYRLEPPRFPEEFPQRLERFKEASGFSWRGLARELCIDIRLIKRWRNGARPDSANLIALFGLAARMGLLHLLLPRRGAGQN